MLYSKCILNQGGDSALWTWGGGLFIHIRQRLSNLSDHYLVVCILLALVLLARVGVGDGLTVSALGLLLCAAGLSQGEARADLWTLAPMTLYVLAAMLSSLAAYGSLFAGFGGVQLVVPALYLLTACLKEEDRLLLRRLCAVLAAGVAVLGLGWFVFCGVAYGRAGRLGGLLGNPNAMGMFLTLGWFVQLDLQEDAPSPWAGALSRLEPVILTALALTLSMGSFVAMGVGLLVLFWQWKQRVSPRAAFAALCRTLAGIVLGMGTGLLLYLTVTHTSVPWTSLLVLGYAGLLTAWWGQVRSFLRDLPRMALLITALGLLVAGGAVAVRPSAWSTFPERLEMMASGAQYLTAHPLLGVGPYQWRGLDLADGGKYFNTWHIHNVPLHVAVELGWPAACLLGVAALRFCRKGHSPAQNGEAAAFFAHNLIDTSFFYLGVLAFGVVTAGRPRERGRTLSPLALRLSFAGCGLIFAWQLYYWVGVMR